MGIKVEYKIGDCLEVLKAYPDDHFDSCVTDPPYGLEFMGKEWDKLSESPNIGRGAKDGFTKLTGSPDNRSQNEGGTWFGSREGASPNYYRTTNARCLRCGKWKVSGRHDGKGNTLGCQCEKSLFPNVLAQRATEMQEWHTRWAKEVYRVLKPGAHLLAFGGTRTYHRMVCALEDVGFEIRDCLMWLYGSGFPKSLDVSKAIDKHFGEPRIITGHQANRGIVRLAEGKVGFGDYAGEWNITEPATPESLKWNGWGTALKPAYEPIVLARKPLEGTVAKNVLKYGTGGINVDGCRIEAQNRKVGVTLGPGIETKVAFGNGINCRPIDWQESNLGRWPSNVLLDESSASLLDQMSGECPVSGSAKTNRPALGDDYGKGNVVFPKGFGNIQGTLHNDTGGASRFFYIAKADRFEREAGLVGKVECARCNKLVEEGDWPVHQGDHIYNDHPTVKPIELMRYLVRLVTPCDGLCLDPFVGSGTTLVAGMLENLDCIGIEKDVEKDDIIFYRLEYWKPIAEKRKTEEAQERKEQSYRVAETVRTLDLFDEREENPTTGERKDVNAIPRT